MKPLRLPPCSLRVKEDESGKIIYDRLRKKWVALTPEEWVRQHFIEYLTGHLGYPAGLIQVEAAFRLNTMLRRVDILVHDRNGKVALIVECKAPGVHLTRTVFDQIINYNFNYGVKFLVVTNGITHYAARVDHAGNKFSLLNSIPDFETINNPDND